MTEYAKMVYDFDLDLHIDRTQQTHGVGLFDVDFRSKYAPNPTAQRWTYFASYATLKKAINGANRTKADLESRTHVKAIQVRVVNALSGEVLWGGD